MNRPLVATPGDPAGIGPEVTIRALATWPRRGHRRVVVLGAARPVREAARAIGWSIAEAGTLDEALDDPRDVVLVEPTGDEPVEVAAIRGAVGACLAGRAGALVTGPIHKARLAARGFPFPDHTSFLGALCGVPEPVMAFVGGSLRVALVTVHLPLAAVPAAITRERVAHTIRVADAALRGPLGLATPRLLVCGLNPHAGDAGLLGHEEQDAIGPAVAEARANGLDARGPMSAEAAFLGATRGEGDLVVAMYHDQGLAPLKAVDFGRSVNWTLGLPFVRTSVDHGTADDLVGTGRADPASFTAALDLADRLAR
jgi:4-hydroxythreonine-4-phosphate dehydrogenase